MKLNIFLVIAHSTHITIIISNIINDTTMMYRVISNRSAIKVDMVDISYSVLGGMTIDIVIVSFIFDSNTILAFDKANFSIRVEDGIIHINSSI
jgi:hypothetical protein